MTAIVCSDRYAVSARSLRCETPNIIVHERKNLRVWLVTVGEPLPSDSTNERLLRTGIVANMLVERGHEVVWWTSTFNHSLKTFRAPGDSSLRLENGLRLQLLHGGGYRRNISLARLRDHRMLARRFSELASRELQPDIIVSSLPPLELSLAATEYARARGIPAIIDVRDLWPDVMFDVAPGPLQPLVRSAFGSLTKMAKRACAGATHIWGHAPEFVAWGLQHANREPTPWDRHFYFGYVDAAPSGAELETANATWDRLGVRGKDKLIVCFTGTIGHQVDLDTVVNSASLLRDQSRIQFVFCGTGDRLRESRANAEGLGNVVFAGWRNRAEIWALLRRASIGLAPYVDRSDFIATIPNKAAEYWSGALPIALSLGRGLLYDIITKNNCGFSYEASSSALSLHLRTLVADPAALRRMSENAHALYESTFRADRVYGEMVDALESIVADTNSAIKG